MNSGILSAMPAVVSITFGSPGSSLDPFSLSFTVVDRPIAQKWFAAFQKICQERQDFHSARFFAFPGAGNKEKVQVRLQESVATINAWKPGRIDFQPGEETNQERLNYLHNHFEQMIGSVEQYNRFFLDAPKNVQKAIDDLNRAIHELEMFKYQSPRVCIEFPDCPREKMTDEDLSAFSFARSFGDLFLSYCQLGKQIMDVWAEKDDFVSKENIRPLHHYSAQCELYLRNGLSPERQKERYALMHDWLVERGYDPQDPKLALGWIVLARLNQGSLSQAEIVAKLGERQRILAVECKN